MPLFSVVVPAYNRAGLIAAALDSVLAQTCPDYELIVVDDGSTDGTAAAVRGYGPRVRLVEQPNRGPGAARNAGVAAAAGEYIAFLDSDDLWFPWTLATFAGVIAAHGRPPVVAGRMVRFARPEELAGVGPAPVAAHRYLDFLAATGAGVWVGVGSVAIRRDEYIRVGGFVEDRDNAEDTDLWLRLGAVGFVHITEPAVAAYRRTPGSATTDPRRTAAGLERVLRRERAGIYPGGPTRRAERWDIITRQTRPCSLALLRCGDVAAAWRLYVATVGHHLRRGRVRYLLAFPALLAAATVTGRREDG